MSSPDYFVFFFNDTATPEIYTLSLHTLFRSPRPPRTSPSGTTASTRASGPGRSGRPAPTGACGPTAARARSEEHTSELQSRQYLVCRLLLEKKKYKTQRVLSTKRCRHNAVLL